MFRWNADGEWQWTRLFGNTNDGSWAAGIAVDGTSHVYVVGTTMGPFDKQPAIGDGNAYLTKWTPDGDREWTRIWGPTNVKWAGWVGGVAVWDSAQGGAQGEIFTAGTTKGGFFGQSAVGKENSFFLTKWSVKGEELWTRIWGSTNDNFGNAVAIEDKKGGVVVGGSCNAGFHGQTNYGRSSAALTFWDQEGYHQWTRLFGPTNHMYLSSVQADSSGYVYASGKTTGPFDEWTNATPASGMYLTRYSVQGAHQWTRVLGPAEGHHWVDGGYCSLQGDRVHVGFATSRGFDGHVRPGTQKGLCVSTYDLDFQAELMEIAPTGSVTLNWAGAWDHLFSVEQSTDLSDPEGWMPAAGIPEMIGAEAMTGTDPQVLPLKAYRLRARPYLEGSAFLGMVFIPAGSFVMGQAGIAEPVREKTISAFWMDSTEVTKTQWDEVRNWAHANGYEILNPGNMGGRSNDCPVQTVNWYDVVKWANARSEKLGLTPCYYTDASLTTVYRTGDVDVANNWVDWDAGGFRLPTEAEWEKAARGGHEDKLFPWGGDTISHSQANYYSTNLFAYDISPTSGYHPDFDGEAFPYLHPVGSFEMNSYGLYDMAGNVWEWCWDWYDLGYYSVSPDTDPRGPDSGTFRVMRGGAWLHDARYCRVANRNFFFGGPGNGDYALGFRCVRRAD